VRDKTVFAIQIALICEVQSQVHEPPRFKKIFARKRAANADCAMAGISSRACEVSCVKKITRKNFLCEKKLLLEFRFV